MDPRSRLSLVVLAIASLSSVTLACSSSSGGTSAAGAPSATPNGVDGGRQTKANPFAALGQPRDAGVPRPTPTGDAAPVPTVDPMAGLLPTCKGAVLCIADCAETDDTCLAACIKDMPPDELDELEAFAGCVSQSSCESDDCIATVCAAPMRVCLGD